MKIIVMVGVSGSGKSTYIKNNYPSAYVVSADHFFEEMADRSGSTYPKVFSVGLLTLAHDQCQQRFMQAINNQIPLIAVDNTNIRTRDRKVYMIMARSMGYEVEVHILGPRHPKDAPLSDKDRRDYLDMCWKRNTHGLTYDRIEKQFNQQKMPAGVFGYEQTTSFLRPLPELIEAM
jgi:hypothetical protein